MNRRPAMNAPAATTADTRAATRAASVSTKSPWCQSPDLTLYAAAYAAVAESHAAELATLDRALLDAGLGTRPTELSEKFADD